MAGGRRYPRKRMATVRRPTPEGRPPTVRLRTAPPPKKPPLPLILGAAGGGLLLIILIIALASSSGGGPPKQADRGSPKPRLSEAPRAADPEILKLEAEGKFKCEEGSRLVQVRLKPDADAPKENVRADLERGLRLLNAGLIAYERARTRSGKSYPVGEPTRLRDAGIRILCTDLEQEGQASCDTGLKTIQSCEGRMTGGSLTDEEKKLLRADLEKGMRLITEGLTLFDRSNQVSGNMFDTSKYGQARKAAAYKLGELK